MVLYRDVIEAAIDKFVDVQGEKAKDVAGGIEGLEVRDDGSVTKINGNKKEIFNELLDEYVEMGGPVATLLIKNGVEDQTGKSTEEIATELDLPERLL
ncbi:MAG: hypothetical protein ABEK01_04000 [Candidatus Nanohaloarchaea archaeon]